MADPLHFTVNQFAHVGRADRRACEGFSHPALRPSRPWPILGAPPPYDLADPGGEVIAILEALKIQRTQFCGLSIGGLTEQWLVAHACARLDSLLLCATAARLGTPDGWMPGSPRSGPVACKVLFRRPPSVGSQRTFAPPGRM